MDNNQDHIGDAMLSVSSGFKNSSLNVIYSNNESLSNNRLKSMYPRSMMTQIDGGGIQGKNLFGFFQSNLIIAVQVAGMFYENQRQIQIHLPWSVAMASESELTETHTDELFPTGEFAYTVISFVTFHDFLEFIFGTTSIS